MLGSKEAALYFHTRAGSHLRCCRGYMLTAHLKGQEGGPGHLDSRTEGLPEGRPGLGRSAKHLTEGSCLRAAGRRCLVFVLQIGVCKRSGLYSTKLSHLPSSHWGLSPLFVAHPGWLGLYITRGRRNALQALSLWQHRRLRGELQTRIQRRHRETERRGAPRRKCLHSPHRSGSAPGGGCWERSGWGLAPLGAQRCQPGPTCPPSSVSILLHLPRSSVSVLSGVRDCPRCLCLQSVRASLPFSESIFSSSSVKGFLLGNAGRYQHCPLSFL